MTARLTQGSKAPAVSLPDSDGNTVNLSDYAGSSVVLYFYPAAMTPGCTTQAVDFSAALGDLGEAGYNVLGVSPDSVKRLAQFKEKSDVGFPLLSDPDRQALDAYGAYGVKKLYGKEVTGVIRSTFVIDPQGRIELAKYNVRASGHVASLAKALKVALP